MFGGSANLMTGTTLVVAPDGNALVTVRSSLPVPLGAKVGADPLIATTNALFGDGIQNLTPSFFHADGFVA
jgi:hypothetical protein